MSHFSLTFDFDTVFSDLKKHKLPGVHLYIYIYCQWVEFLVTQFIEICIGQSGARIVIPIDHLQTNHFLDLERMSSIWFRYTIANVATHHFDAPHTYL